MWLGVQKVPVCFEAEANIFSVLEKNEVQVKGEKLKAFMSKFKLFDSDLSLDWLPACAVTYTGSMAATICTRLEANILLRGMQKEYVSKGESSLEQQRYLDDKGSEGLYREADACFAPPGAQHAA